MASGSAHAWHVLFVKSQPAERVLLEGCQKLCAVAPREDAGCLPAYKD